MDTKKGAEVFTPPPMRLLADRVPDAAEEPDAHGDDLKADARGHHHSDASEGGGAHAGDGSGGTAEAVIGGVCHVGHRQNDDRSDSDEIGDFANGVFQHNERTAEPDGPRWRVVCPSCCHHTRAFYLG